MSILYPLLNRKFVRYSSLLIGLWMIVGRTAVHAQTPVVGIPCYVNGSRSGGGGPQDAFVGVFYNPGQSGSSLSSGASAISHLATFGQIGSTWGTAFDPRVNQFYSAAVLKRHSDYGPSGSGAIYRISGNTSATAVSLLINLDGATGALPGGGTVTINTGDATDHGTLGAVGSPNLDNPAFGLAGKSGLGDIDISPTRNTLWVVNARDRQLIEVNISNPASPTVGRVYPVTTASTGVTPVDGQLRPWALEVTADGSVYVGVVASAESVAPPNPTTAGPLNLASTTIRESPANRAKLVGYVFRLNPTTGAFTQVLNLNLNYERGNPGVGAVNTAHWVPWYDDYTQGFPNTGDGYYQIYPQPLIGDIEILDDGSMLVSLMDRYGLQTGSELNSKPGTTLTTDERGRPSGDVVRVPPSGTGWSSTISQYYGDIMSNLENAAALGGIAYQSGTNEFIGVAVDPVNGTSNGLSVISLNPPALVDNQDLVSFAGGNGVNPSPFLGSKGLALGDVEIGVVSSVVVCTLPSNLSVTVAGRGCDSSVPTSGTIVLTGGANLDRFGFSAGATYTGPAYAAATPLLTFPTNLVTGLPTAGSTYTIRFFSGANTCFVDQTVVVPAVSRPTASISGTASFCPGGSTTLTALGTGGAPGTSYTYAWNTGATTAGLLVSASGTYIVTVTDSQGCTGSASVVVTALQSNCVQVSARRIR